MIRGGHQPDALIITANAFGRGPSLTLEICSPAVVVAQCSSCRLDPRTATHRSIQRPDHLPPSRQGVGPVFAELGYQGKSLSFVPYADHVDGPWDTWPGTTGLTSRNQRFPAFCAKRTPRF